jgi:hypothetical protein
MFFTSKSVTNNISHSSSLISFICFSGLYISSNQNLCIPFIIFIPTSRSSSLYIISNTESSWLYPIHKSIRHACLSTMYITSTCVSQMLYTPFTLSLLSSRSFSLYITSNTVSHVKYPFTTPILILCSSSLYITNYIVSKIYFPIYNLGSMSPCTPVNKHWDCRLYFMKLRFKVMDLLISLFHAYTKPHCSHAGVYDLNIVVIHANV